EGAHHPKLRPAAILPARRAVVPLERPVRIPGAAVLVPEGAVQKPPYKDSLPETSQVSTPTPPTSPDGAEAATAEWRWSPLEKENPIAVADLRESTLNPPPALAAPSS
ncbi:hypothetical protein RZS08_44200, partial [Arthrospira platensis SPKY1]|nr:hypothetical protein [Arthrospira platensis SPKY1]